MGFTKREVVTPKMSLSLELELINSSFTPEEAEDRLKYLFNSGRAKAFSEFIVMMLQETGSSMWGDVTVNIKEVKETNDADN